MTASTEEIYSEDYFNYLHKRSAIRKAVRTFYLKDIRKHCVGKTIDFGCGTGELLKTLPEGSIGFEVNKIAVEFCKKNGLTVDLYNPEADKYEFQMIEKDKFQTFTMNHVLEHIEESHKTIHRIFKSCNRLGIRRIVFTVPGQKGFQMDKTHITFIDLKYFENNGLLGNAYYKLNYSNYFPFRSAKVGHYFRHNELRLVFDQRTK